MGGVFGGLGGGGGADLGKAVLELSTDNSGLERGLNKAEKSTKKFGDKIKKIGGIAVAAAAIGFTAFALSAIGAASALDEAMSKVVQVFGGAAREIEEWANTSAKAFGQSKSEALAAVGVYGNLFRAFGMGSEQAKEMSIDLVELASDLASFNDTPVDQALLALRSGLAGETEPLKKFGIAITQARLQTEALTLGLITNEKEALSPNAKAQASFSLIMQDSTLAQGDFARTSDGLANSQRILAATFGDLKAQLGRALLPAMTAAVNLMTQLTTGAQKWGRIAVPVFQQLFGKLAPLMDLLTKQDVKIIFGIMAATIVVGFLAIATAATISFIATNAALLGIPILIGFVAVAIALLIRHWDAGKNAVLGFLGVIRQFINKWSTLLTVIFLLAGPFGWMIAALIQVSKHWGQFKDIISTVWEAIVTGVQAGVTFTVDLLNNLIGALQATINAMIGFINAIPEIKIPDKVPIFGGLGFGGFNIPEVELSLIPNLDLGAIDFGGIGFDLGIDLSSGMEEGFLSPEATGGMEDAASEAGESLGEELGESAGAAAAEEIVPAFVREMIRREDVASVIEQVLSAREIKWADVGRLYQLGAVRVAEDFMDALQGKLSEIGIMMADLTAGEAALKWTEAFVEEMQRQSSISSLLRDVVDARHIDWDDVASAWALGADVIARDFTDHLLGGTSEIGVQIAEGIALDMEIAGAHAAAEFMAGFQSTVTDLLGNIDSLFASIGQFGSTMSIEDAELQLEILEAQLAAIDNITKLETQREVILQIIVDLEDAAAGKIAEINAATLQQTKLIREQIEAAEDDIERWNKLLEQQREALEHIRDVADAQIEIIEAGIEARDLIIDGLEDELDLKRDLLRADEEALRTYEDAARVHEGIINDIEGALASLKDERAAAWAILGMAPGGGDLPLTLTDAAQDLKDLQDQMAELLNTGGAWDITDLGAWDEAGTAATDEFLALQDEIERAAEIFAELDRQKQEEIAQQERELEVQQLLLAGELEKVAQMEAQIEATESAIEAIEALIEAQEDAIELEEERIQAIKDDVAARVEQMRAEIETTQDLIDMTRDKIQADKEAIEAIQEHADKMIDAILKQLAAEVAAEQERADAITATIDAINANIDALQEQQRIRALERDIIKLQLQLQFDLLMSDEDLAWEMLRQIALAVELREVYERLEDGTLTAIDALTALRAGLLDLAMIILLIIANPDLFNQLQFPTASAANIGTPTRLGSLVGGSTIQPTQAGGALGTPKPIIEITQTFNGRADPELVEQATKRGVNAALRQRGMVA